MTWFLVGAYIVVAIVSTWLLLIISRGYYEYITEDVLENCILFGALWVFVWPLAFFLWLYEKFSDWILKKINGGD